MLFECFMVLMAVVQMVLAIRLLAAGLRKMRKPAETRIAMARYRVVPEPLVTFMAAALPIVEIAIGIFLLVGASVRWAACAAAGLHIGFAMVISVNLLRGRSFDCGCHGADAGRTIDWALVGQNLISAVAAALLAIHPLPRIPGMDTVAVIAVTAMAWCLARLLVTMRHVAAQAGQVESHLLWRVI
ncbi:DoxX family membrane protein [Nocardia brasiliensis]|uniref:DoxX family membrane protein n=1 Tax=Nocardia brasiliensis TaxID=37326 RepID=A0A6G9XN01_NOCBR|nr:MauE/DoxX family redox-associated membrane protein [Nocardia brasiliensis]QIS02321.1 DoxX family membrane protein [Nocardia brasiliensis]